jgi:hypothetical protein
MEAIGRVTNFNSAVSAALSKPLTVESASVAVYFRSLEDHIVQHIHEADAVVGCVAWLTSARILDALASVQGGVSIIVQKEEFLRPDLDVSDRDAWPAILRSRYGSLRSLGCWPDTLQMVTSALIDGNQIEPVRCAGMVRQNCPTRPRMHHKFLVFCKRRATQQKPVDEQHTVDWPAPYAVWTGSFNFTVNGSYSLENAVFIQNRAVADSYYQEWQNVAWLSEPLDWQSQWVNQEWSVT